MVVEQSASLFNRVIAVAFGVEVVEESNDWDFGLMKFLVFE